MRVSAATMAVLMAAGALTAMLQAVLPARPLRQQPKLKRAVRQQEVKLQKQILGMAKVLPSVWYITWVSRQREMP